MLIYRIVHSPKKNKEIKIQLNFLELKAKSIVHSLPNFSFEAFVREFYNTSYKKVETLEGLYKSIIDEKMKNGNIGTAGSYQSCIRIMKLYKPNVSFIDLTPDFLKKFQNYMLGNNRSITTVGIYFRTLRAVINVAIQKKILHQDFYPFGRGKFIIPKSANPKRSLTNNEIQDFFNYVPKTNLSMEDRAKDFWILSYLCNGMNLKDILLLKKKDIKGEFLYFVREKTKNSSSNPEFVEVPLLVEAERIINKWRCSDLNNLYLFPFIKPEMTAINIFKTVQQFIKLTNKYTKLIGTSLGLPYILTTYWARHSFSKAMADSGQPIMYISKCLNHKKITTTQNYLNSFADYAGHDIARKALLNFSTHLIVEKELIED